MNAIAQSLLPKCRRSKQRFTRAPGFSLLELLVALAVFAAMAAAAYGGLSGIARARAGLAAQQDRFAVVMRSVSLLERDLRQAVSRPVLDTSGATLPALAGGSDRLELSRLGYANPRAEARSHIERVGYLLDGTTLRRARYAVLDRAPDTVPAVSMLAEQVDGFRLRYLGSDGAWRGTWPPRGEGGDAAASLPRAVEFSLVFAGLGTVRRVIELPSTWPSCATNTEACTP